MTDWDKEVENLRGGIDFLKLDGGTHKITFLDEGEYKVVEFEGKEIQKIFFPVRTANGEFVWTVTKGATYNSLFGQIALIGRAKGKLKDQTITLIVKGEKKQRDYTVMEALELIKIEANKGKVEEVKV